MKIEFEYNETDSEESVVSSCLAQYRSAKVKLKQSRKRYEEITKELCHGLFETNFEKWTDLHKEADQIESEWKRLGVEF
jgi:hypothetical protein